MATVADILAAAVARSIRNKGQQLAGDTELLNAFNRSLSGMFAVGARVNPIYYGVTADVAAGPGWPWPTDSNLIYFLQDKANAYAEVAVVPYDDVDAEPVLPCVFQLGRVYWPAGLPNDPTGELRFWYSRQPTVAATVGATIDTGWPSAFDELLVSEMAVYLSLKDNRGDELVSLREERDRWLALYIAHLEHSSSIERRRRPNIRRFNTPSMVPIGQLVAGGSGVGA